MFSLNLSILIFQCWTDKYPTDCEIIMNCFAAYLDNCMPPNYSAPEGKPFTDIYFVKAPEKSDTKTTSKTTESSTTVSAPMPSREKCVITQTAQKPPYFFLQLLDDKLDVSPGKFKRSLKYLKNSKDKNLES
jgi:hypothetical protein